MKRVTNGETLNVHEYENGDQRGVYIIKHNRSAQPVQVDNANDARLLISALTTTFFPDTATLKEGTVRKGGVNERPTTPKPDVQPKGQGWLS